MKQTILAAGVSLAFLLSACGGGAGGSSPTTQPSSASISSVEGQPTLMYGKLAQFTVKGSNLDSGISVVAPNCGGIALSAGASATQQSWTCTPSASGVLTVSVSPSGSSQKTVVTASVPVPRVTMKTSLGDIVIELNPNVAPVTVNNFLQYTNEGFYNDKIFHRVISNFMIQGGGYNAALLRTGTTHAPIVLEADKGLSNVRGSIAMARASAPNTATSEFFINVVDNLFLNRSSSTDGYAVFGTIVTGMDTVDAIKAVPVTMGTLSDRDVATQPVTTVLITSVAQTQ